VATSVSDGESPPATRLQPIASRPESLAELVYSTIREAIVSRQLAPGGALTENAIAEQLQVSKTPVREAMLKLEYVGLIQTGDRRGSRVVEPSGNAIRSAYEVRTALEAQAVRILAERVDHDHVREIRAIADQCLAAAEAHDRQGFRNGDRRFHMAMANATDNPLLARFIKDAFDLTWTLRRRDVPDPDASLECAKQHLDISDAIMAGDPDLADSALRAHIRKVQGLVLTSYYASAETDPQPVD
jgi:GntR family transcriptional regulator, rspAB operon transcriptional repressor